MFQRISKESNQPSVKFDVLYPEPSSTLPAKISKNSSSHRSLRRSITVTEGLINENDNNSSISKDSRGSKISKKPVKRKGTIEA
jgi:hypothetical protein